MSEMLRADEKLAIVEWAKGVASAREAAVAAHRRCCIHGEAYYRDTPEGRFMSESDNVCPDLMLRSRYRKELLSPPARAHIGD